MDNNEFQLKWKEWILNYSKTKDWTFVDKSDDIYFPKKYSYCVLDRNEVPFDNELNSYIEHYIGSHFKYINHQYTLIKYEVGEFIGNHCDDYGNNVVTYVNELQPSNCNSNLIVNGIGEVKKVAYSSKIPHEVRPIKSGTRISLSMFGERNTEKKSLL